MAASWSETLNMATAMVETVVGVVPDAVVDSVMPMWTTQRARTHRWTDERAARSALRRQRLLDLHEGSRCRELVRQALTCLLSPGGRRVPGSGRPHPPR